MVFCLWSLSYYPEAALEMVTSKVGLVAKLVDIVKGVPKEKVVRVALATLRQLVVSGAGNAASDMVGCALTLTPSLTLTLTLTRTRTLTPDPLPEP